jgi:hypothetical protein
MPGADPLAIPPVPEGAQPPSTTRGGTRTRITPAIVRDVLAARQADSNIRAEVLGARHEISAQSVRTIWQDGYEIIDIPGRGEVAVPRVSRKAAAAADGAGGEHDAGAAQPPIPRLGPAAPPAPPSLPPQGGIVVVEDGVQLRPFDRFPPQKVVMIEEGCRNCAWWGAKFAADGARILMPRNKGTEKAPCNRLIRRFPFILGAKPDGTETSGSGLCDRFEPLSLDGATALGLTPAPGEPA